MPTFATDVSAATGAPAQLAGTSLLICLPSMTGDARTAALAVLRAALPDASLLVASPEQPLLPDDTPAPETLPGLRLVAYAGPRPQPGWILTSGDYLAAAQLAAQLAGPHSISAILLLGTDSPSAESLRALAASIQTTGGDLAVPCLITGPNDGLVTSALLYPLTRALFAADVRSPLPFNIGLSPRALHRLMPAAQRLAANGNGDTILWPVAESALGGLVIHQVQTGEHAHPQPADVDFNALFSHVAGSIFGDIENKATFWQRARSLPAPLAGLPPQTPSDSPSPELLALVEGFRLAYANLQQIWSLVLPPQTLLALKKLSLAEPHSFHLPHGLWARIVYDVTLAFHLRSINRGHLLGAFTPLYLAWVASYIRSVGDDPTHAAQHIEHTAAAFEFERPYLVARWRWPDRFNP